MTAFVALLRAVNVGGTGKLPMSDLKALCEAAGLAKVRTYIASGNVVFESGEPEAQIKALLEERLAAYAGKPVGVVLRSAGAMATVLARNPFRDLAASKTVAIFLDRKPGPQALNDIRGRADEDIRLGQREIYVHYPGGLGRSRLRIPVAEAGTARNMNTVAALAELAREL